MMYVAGEWLLGSSICSRKVCGFQRRKLSSLTLLNEMTGTSDGANGSMTEGYIYLFNDPLKEGKGWLEKYYLYQVPLEEIALNPNLTQNPGWE